MEYVDKLKDMLEKEVDSLAKKGDLTAATLEAFHKLTDTIKNLDKIKMLENGNGYDKENSNSGGKWIAQGSYNGDGASSRGKHYVRGHYSYNDDDMRDRMNRNSRRYSRSSGKAYIMEQIEEMLDNAESDEERQALECCMDVVNNA